jgi:two-component system, sensor histidine kinase
MQSTALRKRLLALVMAIVLAAIGLSAAGLGWIQQRERGHAQQMLQEKARQLAARVDAELDRTIAALKVLAVSSALQRGDLAAFHQLASRVVDSDASWENVQLLSPEGQQLVNVRRPLGEPLPPLNRPDLPQLAGLTGEPVIADLAVGVVANRPLTPVYVPVQHNGKLTYVLVAAIEPPNWRTLLAGGLLPGMQAALLDRFSFVITNTLDAPPPHLSPVPTAPGELSGALEATNGLAAFHRSGRAQWTVVTFLPEDTVAQRMRPAWLAWAVASLGLLLASALAALAVSRKVQRG